ncbi:unnamed protein product [Meloidogyne enterolobii]|uniref:Uncharacterized protein n=1 Tax=Meloidogyne enterolobii TaxID=390850 RepID=A0ACB0XUZ7_MELEN
MALCIVIFVSMPMLMLCLLIVKLALNFARIYLNILLIKVLIIRLFLLFIKFVLKSIIFCLKNFNKIRAYFICRMYIYIFCAVICMTLFFLILYNLYKYI